MCIDKKTQIERAVKIVKRRNLTSEQVREFRTEVKILQKLDHPNIVKIYEIYEDPKNYYLVQE